MGKAYLLAVLASQPDAFWTAVDVAAVTPLTVHRASDELGRLYRGRVVTRMVAPNDSPGRGWSYAYRIHDRGLAKLAYWAERAEAD